MEFNKFIEDVENNIKKYLPSRYQDADVTIKEVTKNNGVKLMGLIVHQPDTEVTPTIYMEQYYERSKEYGISISDTCKMIAESILENEPDFDMKSFLTDSYVKENVYVRLVGVENNKELLSQVPHKIFHDLAATYHVSVNLEDGSNGSFQVSNELMKRFGLNEEGLYDTALENSMRIFPPKVESMKSILSSIEESMFGMSVEELIPDEVPDMYVLSNIHNVEGASAILYPGVLGEISKTQFAGRDLVVLPSSLHEVIILPKEENMDAAHFRDMVNDVNITQLDAQEVLSNNVYEYDARARALVPMDDPLYKVNKAELKRNGFQLTRSLERNIESLNKATGKNNSLKDIKELEKSVEAAPEVKELASKIVDECRVQQTVRMMQEI